MARTQARRLLPEDPLAQAQAVAEPRSAWVAFAAGQAGRSALGHIPNASHQEALRTSTAFFLLPPGTSIELVDWHRCSSEERFAASAVCVLPASESLLRS